MRSSELHRPPGVAWWIVGSVLAHALVLLALPRLPERAAPPVEMLRVRIEEPPRSAPAPERAPAPSRAAAPRPEKGRPQIARERDNLPPLRPAPTSPPREILSVPRDVAASEPQFTVPAPEKPAEQPRDTGQSARVTPQPESAVTKPAAPRISDAYVLDSPVRYPRTAEHGRVTLRVLVSREGRVASVSMERSSGHVNLDQHAQQAVRRWRFAPARQGSEPVEQWLTVNVDY